MAETYLMAAGLGTVVLLNAAIAFIHILGADETGRSRDTKTDGQAAPYGLRAVSST